MAPKSIAVVGAGERAASSGGAIMQMLRQAGYGGRVVPVNLKGGTSFGYESVTSIAAIGPPLDLAVIANPIDRDHDDPHRVLPGRSIAVIARLRDGIRSDNLSDVRFRDRRGA